jgi:hypothetical protein
MAPKGAFFVNIKTNINVILNLLQNPTGQVTALFIHLADGVLK